MLDGALYMKCNSGLAIKNEVDSLYCTIEDRNQTIRNELEDLKGRISYDESRIDELFNLLGPVLDARTEKPKQKWLWEIFEPNDIEIDFPYNL